MNAKEHPSRPVYVNFSAFKAKESFFLLSDGVRKAIVEEAGRFLDVQDAPEVPSDGVVTRGVYLTTGFRADVDVMIWWIAPTPEAIQRGLRDFRRTELGRRLDVKWSFMGLARPAEFHHDHIPAFLQGKPARRHICVYPFTRTHEWYLLPGEERRNLLTAHGKLAEGYEDILTNTTQSFGLGDDEWLLAFEAERMDRIVDMIRKLRQAEARRYTCRETPFISGVRMSVGEIVDSL